MSEPLIRLSPPAGGSVLEVGEGEMVILTAPPGSGTSAALRALSGEEPLPDDGQAVVEGKELARLSHRQRRRARQALRLFHLPHDPPLISNLTVMENLLLPATFLAERPAEEAEREGLRLLDQAGVGWTASMLPGRLPPEARKAIALVRGFLRRPRVALLDDPLAELDAAGLAGIRPMIGDALAGGGCAILATARDLVPFSGLPYRLVEMATLPEDPGDPGKETS